jgi:putative transposase
VLLSLFYRLVRCLLGLLAVLVRSDMSKDVELLVLRHENQVLRRQVSGRLQRDHGGRLWLTALSSLVSRRRWTEIFPVTPATILHWHRNLAVQMGLREPTAARATVHRGLGQGANRPDGAREPGLGP